MGQARTIDEISRVSARDVAQVARLRSSCGHFTDISFLRNVNSNL